MWINQPESPHEAVKGLEAAIRELEQELPGWWWSGGWCSVSCHASIGPDRLWQQAELLKLEDRTFDNGFHADLPPPATITDALRQCIAKGKAARAAVYSAGQR